MNADPNLPIPSTPSPLPASSQPVSDQLVSAPPSPDLSQLSTPASTPDLNNASPSFLAPPTSFEEASVQPAIDPQKTNFFNPGTDAMAQPPAHTIVTHEQGPMEWTTSAAVVGHKTKSWYGLFILCAALAAIIVYLISRDIVSSLGIVLAAVLFGAVSAKRPRDLHYVLEQGGITIGQKHFVFGQFRSFSIVDNGRYVSIALMPLKRFAPLIAVTYDPQLHEQIVNSLAAYLPLEDYKPDLLDRITSRFNF